MNKVKDSLARLFLLGIAPFVLLGSGFQPTPFQCEGVKGILKMSIDDASAGQQVNFTRSEGYLEGTDLYLRVLLDVEPIQSEPFFIRVLLRGTDFDNDRYSVSTSHHRDMVSEDFSPSVRDAVTGVLESLNIINSREYDGIIGWDRAFECQFHQITLEQQQTVLDIHIGDQVLPDFDFFPLILKAFEEEAPHHGLELVK